MSIRNKILLYFYSSIIPLLGVCLLLVYLVFQEYREEDFQQREKEKISSTLNSLAAFLQLDVEMLEFFGRDSVDAMLNEKMLLFDSNKQLVYSSLDDTKIYSSGEIMDNLSPNLQWIELKEGDYDVVGMYLEKGGKGYYGIYKALDLPGYAKLVFLRKILLGIFVANSLLIFFVTRLLADKITAPLEKLSLKIQKYKLGTRQGKIELDGRSKEVNGLVAKFNQLLERIDLAFLFQKNATNHISHELKTPLTVLVSNLEKMERMVDDPKLSEMLVNQKLLTKSLSEVINVLLEIAKNESGTNNSEQSIRIDELIFDLCDEVGGLYPDFLFSVEYGEGADQVENLSFSGSLHLIRAAITNLLVNCVRYSHEGLARIQLGNRDGKIQIKFFNKGEVLSKSEIKSLFQPFFRGNNSEGVTGHGLGLALVKKIVEIYGGEVTYEVIEEEMNCFSLILPAEKEAAL